MKEIKSWPGVAEAHMVLYGLRIDDTVILTALRLNRVAHEAHSRERPSMPITDMKTRSSQTLESLCASRRG